MAPVSFKLTKNGITRRTTFPAQPDWPSLAAKIHDLFEIPVDKASVSYIDSDDDEVTLSSTEELKEFYLSSYDPNQSIKFVVQDLRILRDQAARSKTVPGTAGSRDTFGSNDIYHGMALDVEDDWERLPGIARMFIPSSTSDLHAFVETVPSDTPTVSKAPTTGAQGTEDNKSFTVASSNPFATSHPQKDKGKDKLVDIADRGEVSSTPSVIADDLPSKVPIHVYDISGESPLASPLSYDSPLSPLAQAESTPKQAKPEVNPPSVHESAHAPTPDPPLPTLDGTASPQTATSLSNDVANLLSALMGVFSSHPELSEGVRNIVRNASNGSYWAAHREAVSRAAGQMRRASQSELGADADDLRRMEEEAGRRISEALGGLFRAFGNLTGTVNQAPPTADRSTSPPLPGTENVQPEGPSSHGLPFMASNPWSWRHSLGPTVVPTPPMGVGHGFDTHPPIFGPGSWASWRPPRARHPHVWPPGPPPPPGSGGLPPFPHVFPPPPPPPPPMSQQGWAGASRNVPTQEWPSMSQDPPTPQDQRDRVEAAKALYQMEKDRYRKQREERRKERERKTSGAESVARTPPLIQIPQLPPVLVSKARGSFPETEMFSVPHRHHTISGSQRPHVFDNVRSIHRITKRLSDMGFTEHTNPALPSKIKEQVPTTHALQMEDEDDLVTTLIEDLLSAAPKTPVASGSGLKMDEDIPGAWH